MDKPTLLTRYYSHLIALQRRAPLTAKTYKYEIRIFLDWLEGEKLDPETAGVTDITRYLAWRRVSDGIESRSAAKSIAALRSFSRFLENEGLENDGLEKNRTNNLSAVTSLLQIPRSHDRLPEVHRKEDVDRLLSTIVTDSPLGIRNRALYELIYSAGLRISEAVCLNIDDLFLSKNLARVRGKGSKERLVVFGLEAIFWLKRYLNEARPVLQGKKNGKALFLGKSGTRLSRKGIWKNYSALAARSGLSTKLHTLRHTFATELLAGGADLRSVQELLGHADISTTQVYTHVGAAHLRESHRKYLPNLGAWRGMEG